MKQLNSHGLTQSNLLNGIEFTSVRFCCFILVKCVVSQFHYVIVIVRWNRGIFSHPNHVNKIFDSILWLYHFIPAIGMFQMSDRNSKLHRGWRSLQKLLQILSWNIKTRPSLPTALSLEFRWSKDSADHEFNRTRITGEPNWLEWKVDYIGQS